MKKDNNIQSRERDLEGVDPWLSRLLEVLYEFKMEDNMSEDEVARKAFISRPAYYKILHGKSEPKILTLRNILGVSNRNFGDLIYGMGGEDREHVALLILQAFADGSMNLEYYLKKLKYTKDDAKNLLGISHKINSFLLKL